ncbi:Hypothetical Protein XCAW_01691 [Xanthomonas citri subsp. citri Aw12879]|nr:Hypothetical Protein XCAW_01691 [Xanthomonas citri subsp. citri Aw12879]AJZ43868.1 hypothetical protein J165_01737 [Xanthomonas citri pv. citri]AJZ48486.1 hypothetical protein J166_01740 [Xanthomonas citri pv. citri]AJZ53105.1 hypothetical protein J167_01739 [Xanthomonas citri pv. citri]AJZ65899.1 hypothetical protein J168_01738 [Xanthomonas citri pv. citri]
MSRAPEVDQGHSQTPNPMRHAQTKRIAGTPHTSLSRRKEETGAEAPAMINEKDGLQQAALSEGKWSSLADDDVVQYPNINERQRSFQLVG